MAASKAKKKDAGRTASSNRAARPKRPAKDEKRSGGAARRTGSDRAETPRKPGSGRSSKEAPAKAPAAPPVAAEAPAKAPLAPVDRGPPPPLPTPIATFIF